MTAENSEPRYQLHYWPIPFRGCFITYLFAYQGVPLLRVDNLDEIQVMKSLGPSEQAVPHMGPPVLLNRESGRIISQMPAIVLFIAHELDLSPEDPFEEAMCMKVLMDCNDLLMEICRYNGSLMWARDEWTQFRSQRLPRWLQIFEESLKRSTVGKTQTTFADIAIFALFGNMTRCLPELEKDLIAYAPGIHAHCARIGSKASLEEHVKEEEQAYGKVYCGGQIEASIREMLALDSQQS